MPAIPADVGRFIVHAGYIPDLINPRTHGEHLMHKKYHDRDPLLTLTADKIKVREWIRDQGQKRILVPLHNYGYQVPERLTTIPCVIKMNNASGRNAFIFSKKDAEEILPTIAKWLIMAYGQDKGEWCYRDIVPGFLEEPLRWQKEKSHIIYRWLCFHGTPRYIEAHEYTSKRADQKRRPKNLSHTVYRVPWRFQKVSIDGRPTIHRAPPKSYRNMHRIATKLSASFDFVRVDLFEYAGKVWFSEMTHYPRSGQYRYNPKSFDDELGALW